MLPRSRRFRKTDAFAVIGVLTLLVWTPAYWAQGAQEREVSGGESWVLPEPRAGDRAVLDLVVQWGDEAPVTVGPLVVIEYRASHPGEAPVPTSFVEVRRYTSTHFEAGPISFRMPEGEQRLYLDQDGRAVWQHGTTVTEGREGLYDASRLEGGVRPVSAYRGLMVDAGNTVHYHPDAVPALMESGMRTLFEDAPWPTTEPQDITSTRTTVHAGHRLYGLTDSFEDIVRSVAPQLNDDYRPTPENGVVRLPLWFHLPNNLLSADASHDFALIESWGWASKEFPTQVGTHAAFHAAASDQRLSIDLVPRTIERGSGPSHPVQHLQGFGNPDPRHQVQVAGAWKSPMVPLGELMSSTTPIHGTLSLADVWRLASDNAAGAPARLIADGARPIEFRWRPYDDFPAADPTPAPAPVDLLQPLRDAAEPVTSKRSVWTLALATTDGRLSVIGLTVEETPEGTFTATVRDNCADPDEHQTGYRWCEPDDRWGRPIDWTTPVPSPDALRQRLAILYPDDVHRTERDGPGRLAWYGPLAYCHWSYQDNGAIGWGDAAILGGSVCTPSHGFWAYRNVSHGDPMRLEGASASAAPAEWVWDREEGHNRIHAEAETGYAYASYVRTPTSADNPALGTPRPVTPASAAVVVDDPLGRSAAYTGLSLVVASLLVRLGAALYAGAHLPMFAALFSRVSKADALLHERRADIVDLLKSDPGLTTQDVAGRLGYSRTATIHHLETLMRTGQILYVQNGQQRHYFPPDGTERERIRVAVARDEGYADLLDVVDEAPGVTLTELTTRLHRSKPRLSRMVARLERLGVLARRREGRTLRVFPAAQAS